YEAEIHLFSKEASKTITQPIVIIESIEGVTSQYTQTEFATNSPIHIASGGQGQSLTYVAYELPEELQLNPITGDITGSISEVGRYYAHIGKVTAEGVHGHPDIHRIDIRSELIQSFEPLPSLQA